jgi:outer membrane protein TolC
MLLFIVGFFASLQLAQKKENAFSLQEVCDYAINHNNRVGNARLDVDIAKKKIWETTAIGLPQINAKITYQDMLDIPTTLIPARIFDPKADKDEFMEMKFGTQHNASYELTVSQLVLQGSYFVALQASKVFLQLSVNSLRKTEIEIKDAVSKSYFLVLLSRRIRKNLKSNMEILQRILYETTEINKAGFIEDTDVDQIKITYLKLKYQLETIRRQIRNSERLLKYQMGLDLDSEITLKEDLDQILRKIDYNEMMEKDSDFTSNINFLTVETLEKSQELLLKKEKSDYLPNISAFFSYKKSAMRDQFNFFNADEKWFPSTIAGININIPIFTSGMRAAKITQAKMELKKVKNQKADVLNGLKLSLADARSKFASAFGDLKSSKEHLALAKRIFEKTQLKFKKGLVSSMELSQTHNQYLDAQTKNANFIYSFLAARLALRKELNQL